MNKDMRFFEVEMSFMAPSGVVIPVTATSPEEAKEIALYLFKDHDNIAVTKVRDVAKEDQPAAQTRH